MDDAPSWPLFCFPRCSSGTVAEALRHQAAEVEIENLKIEIEIREIENFTYENILGHNEISDFQFRK